MFEDTMELAIVVALGAILAGFVQGLSGFAFGLTAMSLWAWTLEPRLAAVLVVFGSLVGQILAAVTVRRGFDWHRLLPFLGGGLLGLPFGVLLLPSLDMNWFKAILGTLLVIWCPAMLILSARPRRPFTLGSPQRDRIGDVVAGVSGGIMSGLGGFAGSLPTLWCTLRGFDKESKRNIIQNFNLGMLSVTMATYLATGIVTPDMWPMLAIVGVALLIPVLLGARVYIGLSDAMFRKIVLGLLTLSGTMMLFSSVPRLMGWLT
jgi:uncharacterized membrane protein YfcA